jgi:4-hydroxy-tetrahydrodipicolinate synthase
MAPAAALPTGVGVALVSIFGDDGRLDVDATTEHAVSCVARGVTSILLAGTTGEPWRLSDADRIDLATAIKAALPETFLFVGTGDPVAANTVALTTEVAQAGVADALVVLAAGDLPAYELYRAVAAAAGSTPVLAYHLSALSSPGIPADAMPSLSVAAIKDSSGDADRLAQLLDDDQVVYVGSPNLMSIAGPCGARGAPVALANTMPETCVAALADDHDAQRRLFHAHVLSLRDFPANLKPGGHL